MANYPDIDLSEVLADLLGVSLSEISGSLAESPPNVKVILSRQLGGRSQKPENSVNSPDRPVCQILGEHEFLKAINTTALARRLFTLARVYDAGHMVICKYLASAKRGKAHDADLLNQPCLDIGALSQGILNSSHTIEDDIDVSLSESRPEVLCATWSAVPVMSFSHLPRLHSLSNILPGEQSASREYAGVGGGGGSDVISASLLGHLLRRSGKEMNLLISTRTWRTGSQGAKGSKMGVKREIHKHGGPAYSHGKMVSGTYRVTKNTYSEGRDLETIPIDHHEDIFIVLDQGEESNDIPEDEKTDLALQFEAVLAARSRIDTVVIVDTGGDVFGGNSPGFSTPDQDVRAQRAAASLSHLYRKLVTAVLAPGVDAPLDAEAKAEKAGGMVYHPTAEEQDLLLDLLVREYQMDGSNPSRFGKTSLCLQAALRGERGWTSLNLPRHVIDTWDNPWSSFTFIRDCMTDIILMPLTRLLPLIDV
ncbi:hypothetical protein LTR84_011321 [Exophiala bonariae]|uniref:Uncharacterized protein n=1 Tax=Exophiala bonariae TaxID=1690606 RepID=A0AAV9MSE5_9EURO|nr:hypothetical protein LTR84_011321 [Exophiala bonariae]